MNEKRGYRVRAICNNKSQISLFLIVAIVLLLSGGLYYYYATRTQKVEYVAPEIVPVKNYVETCLDDVSREGLLILGRNGGYINFPNEINNNPNSFLPTPLTPDIKNPYWWYQGKTAIPPLEFLKKELVDHINDNFENCVADFLPFEQQFDIEERGKIKVLVDFNDNDVKVNLEYPLKISNMQNESKTDISKFFVRVPFRVKKAHGLASKITDMNIKTKFIEYKAIDLIALDDDIPTTDIAIDCHEKRWMLKAVENKLKLLLEVNLPYIRVKGTDYVNDIYVPNPFGAENYSASYYQNHYIFDIGDIKYDDMHVAFIYDSEWPIHLVARPSDGRILKSNPLRGQQLLKFFCIHTWHFTYDFDIPTKITIVDERTEKHDEYYFTFAILGRVDHLQPDREFKGSVIFDSAGSESNDEYCTDLYYNVEILTDDKITREPVKGVNLTFICGNYYCELGETKMFSLGAAAGIRQKMPICSAGFIEATKKGYETKKYPVQTDFDTSATLLLEPIKEISNIKVVKHSPLDYSKELELGDFERATISVSLPDEGFDLFVPYPIDFNFPLILKAKKDYTYDVEIYLTKAEEVIGAYSGIWFVNKDDLEKADSVKFHVVEAAKGEDAQAKFFSSLEEYSKKVPKPELMVKK